DELVITFIKKFKILSPQQEKLPIAIDESQMAIRMYDKPFFYDGPLQPFFLSYFGQSSFLVQGSYVLYYQEQFLEHALSDTSSMFQKERSIKQSAIVVDEKFLPDLVQNILGKLGFDENDVASWSEPIEHINLYPELQDIYIYGRNIPKFVQNKIQSVNPEKILGGNIKDKFGDRKRFLYCGINSHNINAILIYELIFRSSLRNEFGLGLYTTLNLDYAISYTGRNDILEGLISSNKDLIRECHDPIFSEVEQVVGRTELAVKAFEIVYLPSYISFKIMKDISNT
ncbi:13653_t:CDS:2, partial [Funneliformis mosseae]